MSFDQLRQHVSDIAQEMFDIGMKEIEIPQAPGIFTEYIGSLMEIHQTGVSDLFLPFLETPDPAVFDPVLGELNRILANLSLTNVSQDPMSSASEYHGNDTSLGEVLGAGSLIESWSGKAAMGFKENFIDHFQGIVGNQFYLVRILKATLAAEQDLWCRVRIDIDNIAEQTLKKLDSLGDTCSQSGWTITFTVVAAITALAATVPTLGTSDVIAISAAGSLASILSAVPKQDPPQSEITGGDVFEVFDSVRQAVQQEIELLTASEDRLGKILTAIVAVVCGDKDTYVARRPALADATRDTIMNDRYMGFST